MTTEATSNQAPVKREMSAGCKAILERWDMQAVVNDDGQKAELYDADGEFRTTVRVEIDQADLLSLLRYGNHMLEVGTKIGGENVKAGLRALIGAAAEIK